MTLTKLCSSLSYLTPGRQSITSELCFMSTQSYNIFLEIRDMIGGITSVLLGHRHERPQQLDLQMSFCSSHPLCLRIMSQEPYQDSLRNAACLESLLKPVWIRHDDPMIIDQNERKTTSIFPNCLFGNGIINIACDLSYHLTQKACFLIYHILLPLLLVLNSKGLCLGNI